MYDVDNFGTARLRPVATALSGRLRLSFAASLSLICYCWRGARSEE
ncbi:hypothetical protein MANES_04G062801v8 [Manihot esculenta]|uniref:Uncharacterized protein n=1 Tax=Manihot esculenta TaxID=3983 RepID=A0ACB7HUA7_MANES|nr:hypothetical protein MANES_04G062801v8 [Manihot esculenta]